MALGESYFWGNRKILIVEDDESSRYLLTEVMKSTGASVAVAKTGNEAVEYMREQPNTDLVLMDVQLPDKDGLTAISEIRQTNNRVRIITQTAYATYLPEELNFDKGADDMVAKPINFDLLLSKMDRYLSAKEVVG